MGSLNHNEIVECPDEHRLVSTNISDGPGSYRVDIVVKTSSDHFVRRSQEGRCQPGGYPVELRRKARTELPSTVPRQLFSHEAVCDDGGSFVGRSIRSYQASLNMGGCQLLIKI